jgi:hypothetical protein
MGKILGDKTRIGLLELKVKALIANNDALNEAVRSMHKTISELTKDAAEDSRMVLVVEEHEPGTCQKIVSEEYRYFNTDTAGWYSFNGSAPVPLEADDDYDLKDYIYPIFVKYHGRFGMPPKEDEHPCCSIDVLCLDKNGSWDIGYYDYNTKKWAYNSMEGYAEEDEAPVRWEFLPE